MVNEAYTRFKDLCPNCGREIDSSRLRLMAPCRKCLPLPDEQLELRLQSMSQLEYKKYILGELQKRGSLKNFYQVVELEEKVEKLNNMFRKCLGNDMWSAQRTWIKRIIREKSFAILAPTGVGKTVFGIMTALYMASQGKRSYIILPTTLLVKQVKEKAEKFAEKLGIDAKILAYVRLNTKKKKEEFNDKIQQGDFGILITTSQYLSRNLPRLKHLKFDFIFVDDVDALLKSSKNIDRVLVLLGFREEDVATALRLIRVRRQIAYFFSRKLDVPEELKREYEKLVEKVSKALKERKPGVLVVSTATGRVRGQRVKLFRELLGFEVGSRAEFLRNIADVYLRPKTTLEKAVIDVVQRLGKGGLIFVPVDKGVQYAKTLVEMLRENGIKAELIHAREKKALEDFIQGKLDVAVGVAIYYGLLVRGLDYPEVIRYAVFAGIPRFKFALELTEPNPSRLLQLLINIREVLEGEELRVAEKYIVFLRRIFMELDKTKLVILFEALKEGRELSGTLRRYQERVLVATGFLRELLSRRDIINKLKHLPTISIKEEDGRLFIYVPDVMTYLQASGRTSRMYAGGISKGLSVVIIDDEKLFNGLVRQSKWYSEDVEWQPWGEKRIEKILVEVDRDREKIRKILEGSIREAGIEPLRTALMVVESPNKAHTISTFFGRPSIRRIGRYPVYEIGTGDLLLNIIASGGHIYDLTTKDGFHGVEISDGHFTPVYTTLKRCRQCNEQFTDEGDGKTCPNCGSSDIYNSIEIINVIRSLAQEVDVVLIGTDPDTEGEKIGWDIAITVKPFTSGIKRIEFHEITKRAIIQALKNPRSLNENLVGAQLVRRIEDRWIGFELSKKLWSYFGQKTLSAGRVQTPVLGWIIERYNEHLKSRKLIFYVTLSNNLQVAFDNIRLEGRKKKEVIEELKGYTVTLKRVSSNKVTLNPPPPFSTDTMLTEAVRALKTGVDEVMRLAQDLFELGLITYHRTDSTRVSSAGRKIAREYISEKYGEEMFVPREWMKEGAHECIRPTRPIDVDQLSSLIREGVLRIARPLTRRHRRLYDLIFRRFIASQMAPAELIQEEYLVKLGDYSRKIGGYTKVEKEGFLKVYPSVKLLPYLKEGEYSIINIKAVKIATTPLYTQADVIRLMKERGIGRPSTYAKIVKTLLDRGYVFESKKRKLLIPTKKGIEVYNYLSENYKALISEKRTRIVEAKMDEVEEGKADYQQVLLEFYNELKNYINHIETRTLKTPVSESPGG
ncbi:MAG: reverse gyrase [Thermoproteales archaeon]|nr:reverse gyrase [Thermoproteales archaeon]